MSKKTLQGKRDDRGENYYILLMMWFFVSMFYAYQYVVRVIPNVTAAHLMEKFQIDADVFTQYSGVYYLLYPLAHIPVGLILDKYSSRKVIPICIMLCVAGVLPLILSDSLVFAKLGRALSGIGSVAAFLGACKVIRIHFGKEKFTRMVGLTTTIGFLGAVYGGFPVSVMFKYWGWHYTLSALSIVGIVLAILCYISIPAREANSDDVVSDYKKHLKSTLLNKKIIIVSLLAGLMTGAIDGFADVWSVEFLHTVHGIDKQSAAFTTSLIFLAMAVGLSVIGIIAEKTGLYYQTVVLCGVLMMGSYIILLTMKLSLPVINLLYIAIGLASAFQLLTLCKAVTYVSESASGLAVATANMIVMFFGYLFHRSTGKMMTYFWDGTRSEVGIPLYTADGYVSSMSIFPMAVAISIIGFIILIYSERKSVKG